MQSKVSGIIQIAAVYVGTVVGAGFATGREIVEFFTKYGFYGLLGICVAGLIFIYFGTKVMLVSVRINARSYQDFNAYLFGDRWALYINGLFFIMLFCVNAVMLSGAGSLFEEQLGMPKTVGIGIAALLALLVLHRGTTGLFAINVLIVPAMILFSFIIFFHGLGRPGFTEELFAVPEGVAIWRAFISPVLYSAFNLALSQAVLVPIAYEVKDAEIIKKGGILGGACLTAILLTSHLSLISLPDVLAFDIPTAELMKGLSKPFYLIFVSVIFGEIFTSLVGNTYGIERQLHRYIPLSSTVLVFCLLAGAYFISLIPYRTLLSALYPLFGYIGVVFLFLLVKVRR